MASFPLVVFVQSLSSVLLFETPWTAAYQAPLSFTIPQSLLKVISTESTMLSNRLSLCCPFLLLPSIFPSMRVFSIESVLHIRCPKVLELQLHISSSNEYSGLISFGLIGLTSLQAKELSRVFSSTTIWKHEFFGTRPSLWSNSHIHTWLPEKQ